MAADFAEEYDDDAGDGTPLKWERIGWKAVAKSHRAPTMDFMYVVMRVALIFEFLYIN